MPSASKEYIGSQETTLWPAAVASALKLAGPSPHPRMRPARSPPESPNMRRYSSKDRPHVTISFNSIRSPLRARNSRLEGGPLRSDHADLVEYIAQTRNPGRDDR